MSEQLQRGFVLHRKLYSETSLLIDVFTEHAGKITLLAKGARAKRSAQKGILQPFVPLLLRWVGKGSLKTLTQVEAASLAIPLHANSLYSGFYLNEILQRSLENETSYNQLFQDYLTCLTQLALNSRQIEPCLRIFELQLLDAIGYAIDFQTCTTTNELIKADRFYQYIIGKGFIWDIDPIPQQSFLGQDLLQIHKRDFSQPATLLTAKRFLRIALKPYIGNQPLKSKELFQNVRRLNKNLASDW